MGLDMYLTARRYIYGFGEDEVLQKALGKLLDVPDGMDVNGVEIRAGYWRKANAIHGWFVDNVQEGVDECVKHDVSREQLEELRGLCQQVLAEPERAKDLLPVAEGFFFGSYEYDDWYLEYVANTIKIVDAALVLPDDWEFTYQSSW